MCTRASTSLAKGCLHRGAKNVRVSFIFCFCATARASYGLQSSARSQNGTRMMDGCMLVNEPVPEALSTAPGSRGAMKAGSAREVVCCPGTCTPRFAPAVMCWEEQWQIHRALPFPCRAPSNRDAKAVGAECILGDKCCHLAWPFFLCAKRDVVSWRTGAD